MNVANKDTVLLDSQVSYSIYSKSKLWPQANHTLALSVRSPSSVGEGLQRRRKALCVLMELDNYKLSLRMDILAVAAGMFINKSKNTTQFVEM